MTLKDHLVSKGWSEDDASEIVDLFDLANPARWQELIHFHFDWVNTKDRDYTGEMIEQINEWLQKQVGLCYYVCTVPLTRTK